MGDLIRLADRVHTWREVFRHEGEYSSLRIYVDDISGEIEVFQMNDDSEAIRSCLPPEQSRSLIEALKMTQEKSRKV